MKEVTVDYREYMEFEPVQTEFIVKQLLRNAGFDLEQEIEMEIAIMEPYKCTYRQKERGHEQQSRTTPTAKGSKQSTPAGKVTE